ncbi:MAG: penicillin-binding protein 2 [Pseudomonadota bacterium]
MTDFATSQSRGRTAVRGDMRLILLMVVICVCYAAVGLRMGVLALTDPVEPTLARSGDAGRPVRGDIVDRNGQLLAANLPGWSLYAHPHEMKDPVLVADALSGVFPSMDRDDLIKKLTGKRRFVWIKRPVSPRERQAVHELGYPGLHFGAREIRIYPAGRTAGHIVGGVKAEREGVRFAEFVGSAGIEKHFDARLRDPAKAAEPLRLSIDITAQAAMRQAMAAGIERFTAKGASAVLMKVKTGEIVALASLPDFDPNDRPEGFRGAAELNPRFNRVAQGRYELGSTFKVLTAAMALETGVANDATLVKTPPALKYGRHNIRDFYRMPKQMSVEEIVVKSSNVGSARLSMMIGTRRFKDYLRKLGFFDPSGLELSEAARAKPLLPERWTDLSSMTISFGHGLAASPVHLAAAFATLANDGRRVHPTLIAGGTEPDKPGKRVFSSATSKRMLEVMRQVVVRGTARRTDLPGYEIGGKTGTAEKVRPGGGYFSDRVISTFAAVFPTTEPEYVLIISLDEPTDRSGPKPVRSAGRTAVPVAADIIARVAPILDMRPRLMLTDDEVETLDARLQ